MFENPGGHGSPYPPLPTPMVLCNAINAIAIVTLVLFYYQPFIMLPEHFATLR